MPGYYISMAIVITGVGLFLSYLTYSYRKLLRDAVKFEVQNVQLGRYFSPGILNQIKNDDDLFHAKKSNIVVMFTDIRDFTAISEKMDPGEIVLLLRTYHRKMIEVIYRYGGTIDKFLGDGIMVTFGTPSESSDDCRRALLCGIELTAELQRWNAEREASGLAAIKQGIGIHYGNAVSGNIGSEDRLEFTVIGDAVNLASRIESQCKATGEKLLMSADFAKMISTEFQLREVGTVSVKGRQERVILFTVA